MKGSFQARSLIDLMSVIGALGCRVEILLVAGLLGVLSV